MTSLSRLRGRTADLHDGNFSRSLCSFLLGWEYGFEANALLWEQTGAESRVAGHVEDGNMCAPAFTVTQWLAAVFDEVFPDVFSWHSFRFPDRLLTAARAFPKSQG
jgi:hypothetical protein